MSLESQPVSSITFESKVSRAITSGFELLARTSFGQGVLKVVDRVLYVVEASTQWSLPPRRPAIEENGKSSEKIELARPLPWILFLPTLILLRSLRLCANLIAPLFGFSQVEPSDTISCVQKYRRRLRNALSNSVKDQQESDAILTDSTGKEEKRVRSGARSALKGMSALFCSGTRKSPSPSPTRIIASPPKTPENKDSNEMLPSKKTEEKQKGDGVEKEKQVDKVEEEKEGDDVEEMEDSEDSEVSLSGNHETLLEKIDRMALVNESVDSDFDPGNFSESDDSEEDEEEEEEGNDELKNELNDLEVDQKTAINVPNQKKSEKVAEKRGKYLADKLEQKEVAFYSPISSKSVSPERPISPIRRGSIDRHNFGNNENGGINRVAQYPNLVNNSTFLDDGTSNSVTNGRTEEKQQKKSSKIHHHKIKKSNCRKRK